MHFKFGANHDGQTLQVRYVFTNDTTADVYVQHFVTQHPEVKPSCYIYHLRPDQVVLWAGTPPTPPLVMFGQPPTSLAERLPPGESLDVLLRLPLPLVESGHCNGPEGPLEPASANVIRFRLDLQPKRRGLEIREVNGRPGSYWVGHLPPVVLEATTTVDRSFVVHRRGEHFHRGGLDPMDPLRTPW